MNITISLGLEDLKTLPLELRQKIQQALDLPVIQAVQPVQSTQQPAAFTFQPQQPMFAPPTPAQIAEAVVQQVTQMAAPVVVPAFTLQPQQPQFTPPAQPTKEPVIVDGVRTFPADRNNPNASSVAVDITTGQQIPLNAPPAGNAPVVPQFSNAPLQVTPVPVSGPVNPAPMPAANVNDVRSAAIRLWNGSVDGKQRLQAAIQSCGVQIAALSEQNAGALAQALRQQGVQI